MQKRIASFIQRKYLCTICCTENNQPWANAVYYVFDKENERLIYVSSMETHHSRVIMNNANVAGTIFTPTRFNPSLQGVQFIGKAKKLEGDEEQIARQLYKNEYEHKLADQLPIWEISLEYVRLIDHALGLFGTLDWRKGDPKDDDESDDFSSSLG